MKQLEENIRNNVEKEKLGMDNFYIQPQNYTQISPSMNFNNQVE